MELLLFIIYLTYSPNLSRENLVGISQSNGFGFPRENCGTEGQVHCPSHSQNPLEHRTSLTHSTAPAEHTQATAFPPQYPPGALQDIPPLIKLPQTKPLFYSFL